MSPPGSAKLIVRMPDGTTLEHELEDRVMHIGRDPACEIHIPSHYVSRRHAVISPAEGRFIIQDERSTNGLQINGRLVREPHTLSTGDRVVLGDVSVTYEEAPDDPFATAVYAPVGATAEAEALDIAARKRGSRSAGLCTILFTDLVDHTAQVTRLGDVAGQRWLHQHIRVLRDQFQRFDGLEDKWTGDGFLVTFDSARRGVQCAVAIQRALSDYNREHADAPIHVRIGLNPGEILKEEDELFGNAVILAARVMSTAGADQILISELMYRLVQSTGEFTLLDRGLFQLKGFVESQRLYEVQWREPERERPAVSL